MKFLQINLHTCRLAHHLLSQFVLEQGIDICIVSEPNEQISQEWGGCSVAKIWRVNRGIYVEQSGCGSGFSWIQTNKYLIISVYSSRNDPIESLENTLTEISCLIRSNQKEVILGGDVNSRSPEWGSDRLNARGRILSEWIAAENLVIQNLGNTPTFRNSRDHESVIDITLSSERTQINSWCVWDDYENGSDHQYICFELTSSNTSRAQILTQERNWNMKSFDPEKLKALMREINEDDIQSAEDLTRVAADICQRTMRTRVARGRKEVHWWSEDISKLRRECIKARRYFTRNKRRVSEETKERLYQEYKSKRTLLNIEVSQAKKEGWKKICKDLDQDVWGLAYKIVTKKIGRQLPTIPCETRERIINELFPAQPVTEWNRIEIENFDDITIEEVAEAALRIKPNKAPGPDCIPATIIKEMILENPRIFQRILNNLWQEGQFPRIWKEARVVLIEKPKKNLNDISTYRPICLLNSLGKTYETLLNERLKKELQEKNLLSSRQYGFRAGLSTVDAVKHVTRIAKDEMAKTNWKRKLCILITCDIKNAFNTANWREISEEMKNMGLDKQLVRSIESYLSDRKIVGEEFNKWMTGGVCQGSVVAPTLWNILYNSILNITVPEGVTLIAYADDLSVVITGKNEGEIELKANETTRLVTSWMREKKLTIAPEKSELIVLSGKKKCRPLNIEISGTRLIEKNQVKYLGVVLDKSLKFGPHLEYVIEKAGKTTKALSRIMPNVGGPGESKRRVLQTAAESVILYAAPVWHECLKIKKRRTQILRAQRPGTLRVCSGYRTISTDAAAVISGVIPLDLKLEERANTFLKNKQEKLAERERTIEKWQERWNTTDKGAWTRTLIKEIGPWTNRKFGEIDYYTTQILSGHGCFEHYKQRFKLSSEPNCRYCGDIDTAEHTMFQCPRWSGERVQLAQQITVNITKENLIAQMLEGKEKWESIVGFIHRIMKTKIEDERISRLQEQNR